jgi:serine/threonine protein kinase
MGLGDYSHQVYIIDFGLAKQYRDPKTHLHIPYKENCTPTGTMLYASINNHMGVEQSRRDDLESLAYMLVYFLCGSLPWHGVEPGMNTQRRNVTLRWKQSSRLAVLCSTCPPEFGTFLDYARALAFDEKPDYNYLRKLFRELLTREGHQYGHPFPDGIISKSPCVGTRAMTRKRKVLEEKIEMMQCMLLVFIPAYPSNPPHF